MECLEQAGFNPKRGEGRAEMDRFSLTANRFYRHHDRRNEQKRPRKPMDLLDARRLLHTRVNAALDQLARQAEGDS
jgi:hypothetical protein